jgi:SAM-dependent methyltransferase
LPKRPRPIFETGKVAKPDFAMEDVPISGSDEMIHVRSASESSLSCPVCGSGNAAFVHVFSAQDAAQRFVLRDTDRERHDALVDSIRSLWKGNICEIRRCRDCDFGFTVPFVSGDPLFYSLAYPVNDFPREKWEYVRTVQALRQIYPTPSEDKVLELGAGSGKFLEKIVPSLFARENATAVDFDAANAQALRAAGYRTIHGDIRMSLPEERGYRAIFMFQILEHLDHPRALFSKLHELLEPDGHLFLAVPNGEAIEWNEAGGGLVDMPPNHISRWRERTFEYLASRTGFQVIATEAKPFSMLEALKDDTYCYYMGHAQRPGTLAHWARLRRYRLGGRWLGIGVAALYAFRRIPHWLRRTMPSPALWVHLRKASH